MEPMKPHDWVEKQGLVGVQSLHFSKHLFQHCYFCLKEERSKAFRNLGFDISPIER